MKLERTGKEAYAKLAQAEARLRSAQGKYRIEQDRVDDLRDQIEKCVIRAERTGLVVYGSSGGSSMYRGGGREPIQEGATVWERQKIITIPDMTKMAVIVKVHESSAEKVKPGQWAGIRVDAHSNELLEGEVVRVAPLPDSADRFLNPDMKVYSTTVRINDVADWLKPGMSAEVQILVKELPDVVYIPLQAVVSNGDENFCYVAGASGAELRSIETGEFTDEFVEIRSGLEEGERVYLTPPDSRWEDTDAEEPA